MINAIKRREKSKKIQKTPKIFRKVLSFVLSLGMFSGVLSPISLPITEAYALPSESGAQVPKRQQIKEGTILHCFCWDFDTIKENLDEIKEAGFTAIQTSPVNACAGSTTPLKLWGHTTPMHESYNGNNGAWWWHYQPLDWKIGNYQFGTEAQFRAMVQKADELGIHVLVDVVPNHTSPSLDLIPQEFVDAVGGWDEMYHAAAKVNVHTNPKTIDPDGGNINWASRHDVTLKNTSGLPSVNTENPKFQKYFMDYINELVDAGVDGFRYDTTKHIGLPGDPVDQKVTDHNTAHPDDLWSNDFWLVATGRKPVLGTELHDKENLYIYGEVLQDNDTPSDGYAQYLDVTASSYGHTLREQLRVGSDWAAAKLNSSALMNWHHPEPDRIVTWVESHDTYCNEGESANLTDEKLRFGWAAIAARKQGTPLFFSRPMNSTRMANRWGDNIIGARGNDEFMSTEVREVNRFRTAMAGEDEYLRNIDNDKTYQIDRGSKGTCIINIDGAKDIHAPTTMADGTYIDHVSRRTFQVSGGHIRGHLDEKRIAVIYEADPTQTRLEAVTENHESFYLGDKVKLHLTAANLTETTYIASNQSVPKSFLDGDSVMLAAANEADAQAWIELKGKNAQGEEVVQRFTFDHLPKHDLYFRKHEAWGEDVYCYNYDNNGDHGNVWNDTHKYRMTHLGHGIYGFTLPRNTDNSPIFNTNMNTIFRTQIGTQWKRDPDDGYGGGPGHAWDGSNAMIYNRFLDNSWRVAFDREPEIRIESFTANPLSVEEGETVTFTAQAGGTGSSFEYKFTELRDGRETQLQDFSPNAQISHTLSRPAKIYMKVEAKDEHGNIASGRMEYRFMPKPVSFDRSRDLYIQKPRGWRDRIYCYIYDDSSTPTRENAPWPGEEMEYIGGDTFGYSMPAGWSSAKVVFNDFDGDNLTTDRQHPATGQFLSLREGESKRLKSDLTTWETVAKDPIENIIMTPSVATPQLKGTAVTFTATATGGVGGTQNLEYKFLKKEGQHIHPDPADMELVQDYSTTNSITITQTEAATYTIKVLIRDAIHQEGTAETIFVWEEEAVPTPPTPPSGGGTTPPSGGSTTPPSGGGTTPPSGGSTTPPSGGSTTPPSGGSTTPPSGGSATPPSGGSTTPPSGGSTTPTPPSGGSTTPPSGGSTTPPSGGSTTPPSGGSTTPPSGGSTTPTPPSGGSTTPTPPSGGNTTPTPRSGGGSGASSGGSSGGRIATSGKSHSGKSKTEMNGSWQMDAKGWWFKNTDGSYPKNNWKLLEWKAEKNWYYFDAEGYAVNGWKKIDYAGRSSWYYFDASAKMLTGWQWIDGKWYYLYPGSSDGHAQGEMAADVVIDGYAIDTNGAWIQ